MAIKLREFFTVLSCVFYALIILIYILVFIFRKEKTIFPSTTLFIPLELYVYIETSTYRFNDYIRAIIPNQDIIIDKRKGIEIRIDMVGDGLCWFITGMQMLSSLDILQYVVVQAKNRLIGLTNKEIYFIYHFTRFYDLFYTNRLINKQDISELYKNIFLTLQYGYLDLVLNNQGGCVTNFLRHLLERIDIEMPGLIYPTFFSEYSFLKEVYSKTSNQLTNYSYSTKENMEFIVWNTQLMIVTIKDKDLQCNSEYGKILYCFKKFLENHITGTRVRRIAPVIGFELEISPLNKNINVYNIEEIKNLIIKITKPNKEIKYRLKSYALRLPGHVFACNLSSNGEFYNTDIEINDLSDDLEIKECNLNDEHNLSDIVFLFEED